MATATTLRIVAIALLANEQREIEICLTTGQRICVYGSNGGYIQYGIGDGPIGSEAYKLYAFTQPIAQRWASWLNGGRQPRASKRYPAFTDLALYENLVSYFPTQQQTTSQPDRYSNLPEAAEREEGEWLTYSEATRGRRGF